MNQLIELPQDVWSPFDNHHRSPQYDKLYTGQRLMKWMIWLLCEPSRQFPWQHTIANEIAQWHKAIQKTGLEDPQDNLMDFWQKAQSDLIMFLLPQLFRGELLHSPWGFVLRHYYSLSLISGELNTIKLPYFFFSLKCLNCSEVVQGIEQRDVKTSPKQWCGECDKRKRDGRKKLFELAFEASSWPISQPEHIAKKADIMASAYIAFCSIAENPEVGYQPRYQLFKDYEQYSPVNFIDFIRQAGFKPIEQNEIPAYLHATIPTKRQGKIGRKTLIGKRISFVETYDGTALGEGGHPIDDNYIRLDELNDYFKVPEVRYLSTTKG